MGVRGLEPYRTQTISWLKDYLTDVGPINSYGFYQYLQETGKRMVIPEVPAFEKHRAEQEQKARLAPSYDSIRRLFWMLRQVEAIEFSHHEPSAGGQPKAFYRMKDPAWFIPGLQVYFYPASALGRRYRSYKRQGRKLPPPPPPEGKEAPPIRSWTW